MKPPICPECRSRHYFHEDHQFPDVADTPPEDPLHDARCPECGHEFTTKSKLAKRAYHKKYMKERRLGRKRARTDLIPRGKNAWMAER